MMYLTKRERQVLTHLAAHEGDDYEGRLIYERGVGYVGDERISARLLFSLLRLCAISLVEGRPGGVEHYEINETGRGYLEKS